VIANNRSYRILKERLISMRKSERFVGMDLRDPEIDFVSLARSMGVDAQRVSDPQALAPALREAMRAGGPRLVEVMIADGFGT
jgi:benzoylformate decarboxylase